MSAFQHIGVLGAGAWGSALANIAARAGRRITLWARDPRVTETIARWRESPKLPGMRLENLVTVTGSIQSLALDHATLWLPGQSSGTQIEQVQAVQGTAQTSGISLQPGFDLFDPMSLREAYTIVGFSGEAHLERQLASSGTKLNLPVSR